MFNKDNDEYSNDCNDTGDYYNDGSGINQDQMTEYMQYSYFRYQNYLLLYKLQKQ